MHITGSPHPPQQVSCLTFSPSEVKGQGDISFEMYSDTVTPYKQLSNSPGLNKTHLNHFPNKIDAVSVTDPFLLALKVPEANYCMDLAFQGRCKLCTSAKTIMLLQVQNYIC